jgi:GTP cyclohydrolase I
MTEKRVISTAEVREAAKNLAAAIAYRMNAYSPATVYGIPRGGTAVAKMVADELIAMGRTAHVVTRLVPAHKAMGRDLIIVDDMIDSGRTLKTVCSMYPDAIPGVLFSRENLLENHPQPPTADRFTLVDAAQGMKTACSFGAGVGHEWLVFPWEVSEMGEDMSADDIIIRLLQHVGENPNRGGLLETPKRVLKAWAHWTSGYAQNPADILKVFEDGAEKCDEMVIVRSIPLYSHCEHHLAPIFGIAHVAYIPNGRIVGLSKLSRLVDIFARRLQVQERLTNQIADALDENLKPLGVGVIVEARHLCMESRGVCQQGHTTRTSALRGVLKTEAEARAEFMRLALTPNQT